MLSRRGASVERRYSFTETVAYLKRQKNLDILTNSKSVELDSLHSPYLFPGAKIHAAYLLYLRGKEKVQRIACIARRYKRRQWKKTS